MIVDLTHPIADGTPAYPGDPGVTLETFHDLDEAGYHVGLFTSGTHVGTHVDVPRHVRVDGMTSEQIDLSRCVGPARVVEVLDAGPGGTISAENALLGNVQRGERLLFRTGWSSHWGEADYFTDFPDLDLALARRLAAAGVVLVGLEQPSVHRTHHLDVHRTLLDREILIVEGLRNLDELPERVMLACLPLPIVGGDGGQCRAVAWELG